MQRRRRSSRARPRAPRALQSADRPTGAANASQANAGGANASKATASEAKTNQPTESRVAAGVVRRPWGFDGSIAVAQHSDDPSRFRPRGRVFIDGAAFSIERVQYSGKSTVLKLASVNTEDQASALRGKTIELEVAALPPQPTGVYYHYQIIGARVVTVGGEELGTVSEILETGSNDVYVVRAEPRPGQKSAPEILVPALKDVIMSVDIERGVIEVDLPEGLR